MAHVILNDRNPESAEYLSNWFEFDEDDPHVLDRLFRVLRGADQADPSVRRSVLQACQSNGSQDLCT